MARRNAHASRVDSARGAGRIQPAAAPARPFPVRWVTGALLLLTVAAYMPILGGGFLQWDDQYYVEQSTVVHDPAGLPQIWSPAAHATDQYYPLTFTSYWIEYRLWGLDARGYHAVNVALHLVNTVLVLGLAGALGASPPVQCAVAAVFALHPVQVASVAWIAERKNTLSGLFYLGAFLLYLRHRRSGRWGPYVGALAAFAAALLSKTQTVTLPLSLAVAEWCLRRTSQVRRLSVPAIAARLAPMAAIAVGAGLVTVAFEQRPWTRSFTTAESVVIAANTAAFYVRTFLFPVRLSPVYPEWHVTAGDPAWWLPIVSWIVVLGGAAVARPWIPALAAFGIAQFFIVLAPVLGFVPFDFQTYTFIADHFLYLAVIGGGLALAVGVERAVRGRPWRVPAVAVAAGVLGLAAAVQTAREASHWRTNESFWLRVRERDPDGFLGNYNLGNAYRRDGRWADALPYYRRAAEIRPNVDYPFRRFADALRHAAGEQAVIDASTQKLAAQPQFFAAYLERGASYEALGDAPRAAADYDRALRFAPRGSAAWEDARRGRARLGSP
jgi:tetratricopeptide (TPR) repeat protein